jgi:hypothetical protein
MLIFKFWLVVINWVAASTLHYCDLVLLLDLDKLDRLGVALIFPTPSSALVDSDWLMRL